MIRPRQALAALTVLVFVLVYLAWIGWPWGYYAVAAGAAATRNNARRARPSAGSKNLVRDLWYAVYRPKGQREKADRTAKHAPAFSAPAGASEGITPTTALHTRNSQKVENPRPAWQPRAGELPNQGTAQSNPPPQKGRTHGAPPPRTADPREP